MNFRVLIMKITDGFSWGKVLLTNLKIFAKILTYSGLLSSVKNTAQLLVLLTVSCI